MDKKKKKWSDMTPGQKTGTLVVGAVQLSLAAAAWADLAKRPSSQVKGSKIKWAFVIAMNFIGPILYFTKGRVPQT